MDPTFNDLLKMAQQKTAIVDAASLMGGGAPPGGDPMAAAGGAPPGGDPMAAAGGAPPGGDPMAAGGGAPPGGVAREEVMQMIQQAMASSTGGAGGAGGAAPIKPKIDVNVTLVQILKILAKIADSMGISIPASDMVQTQADLTQFGMQQASGQGSMPTSTIQPPEPMGAAAPGMSKGSAHNTGRPYGRETDFEEMTSRAAALATLLDMRSKC